MKDRNSRLVYSTDPETRKQIQNNDGKNIDVRKLPPAKQTIKIFLQTKGRGGKKVTVVEGFQEGPENIKDLAKEIKQFCGTGGTVKGKIIEIQGDNRKKVAEKLEARGYKVKGVASI